MGVHVSASVSSSPVPLKRKPWPAKRRHLPHCWSCGLILCRLDDMERSWCWICTRDWDVVRITPHRVWGLFEAAVERGLSGARATEVVVQRLRERPCAYCAQFFPPCTMEFHHIHVGDKAGMISTLRWHARLDELIKCIVLCANCHRIEETARGPLQR